MINKHNRIVFFFVGLLAGIIICILILLLLNYKNANKSIDIQTKTGSFFNNGKKNSVENSEKKTTKVKYTPSKYKIPKNNLRTDDSLSDTNNNFYSYEDSLRIDSINRVKKMIQDKDEDFVVMKDELLFVKNISVSGKSNKNNKSDKKLDSLLTENIINESAKNVFHVEFWKSPINYNGYKMINNRIILFGIYQYNNLKLRFINDNLYLDYLGSFYLIKDVSDFMPLIPVNKKEFEN